MDTLILPIVHAMLICLTHMLCKDIISRYVSTAEILSRAAKKLVLTVLCRFM